MKNFLYIMLLVMVVFCWGCSGGGEDVPTPTPTPKPEEKPKIEVTTAAPVLSQEGGNSTVTFTSTDSWTIDVSEGRSVSWCSVTPTSGGKGTHTLTIKTTANDTYDERNAQITIKAGTITQSFIVTQKQKDGLIVTSNKIEIGTEGGDITIEVKANVNHEYEIEEAAKTWIVSSDSRALAASTLKFKVSENEDISRREGKITLRGGELSETVTVYQEGSKPTIVLTQNEYTIGSEGETIKVELKSNVNYDIQMPGVDWIKESSSRAMSAYTHYFDVSLNEGYNSRSAEIFFINEENGVFDKVTINQMQRNAIIVAKDEYTMEAAGGDLKFEVNSNVDFTVSTTVDWIKQNAGSRGLEAKALNFTIEENVSDVPREGMITLISGELKQEVKVIQKAKSTFSVSQTLFNVTSAGGNICVEVSTNGGYTLALPEVDWLEEVTSRATSTYRHTFKVSANETYDSRATEFSITHQETGEVAKVKIVQAQKNAIIVAKNEYTMEAAGGDLKFEVNSNVDFTVSTTVDWIKQNAGSRGLEAKALNFTVEENTSDEPREGMITLISGELKQEVKVIQKGAFNKGTMGELESGGGIEEG